MTLKISAITPTCDRPFAMELLAKYVARQTLKPSEWFVCDGGSVPAIIPDGAIHVREARPPGPDNFAMNLLNGIRRATGDVIVFLEDDDWLARDHIETLVDWLERYPHALAAGEDKQRYYNVRLRCWRVYQNVGASLCQTAMRRGAIGLFESAVRNCQAKRSYGIDTTFWRSIASGQWCIVPRTTVIGIKGLPGQPGLGVGHRPNGLQWNADPDGAVLREWCGEDAEVYSGACSPQEKSGAVTR